MKIKKLTLYKIEIPMVTTFTTSFGTQTRKPTVIVRAETTDSIVGWGESSAMAEPLYKPETVDTCMLVLKSYIAPLVLNKEFKDVADVMATLKQIKGHNFAKTGLETALWYITSVAEKKSLKKLLGGTQEKIAVGESLGIQPTIDATLEEVQLRLKQGFVRIKLKIKPSWDLELVKAVKEISGDTPVMVDGNSAYTLEHLETLKKLDKFDLLMMEQPLADDDIIDHATLQKEISTPVCLDESILSPDDARKAIQIDACKIINIKPGRVGGLLSAKRIHDICQEKGIGVWCGGMLETGVGRYFNIAVASLPNYIYPADMSPVSFFYEDDIVKKTFTVDDGHIAVPDEDGPGFEIDEEKLTKYTVEKVEL